MRGFFVALGSSEWQERAASCAALHPNRYSEIIFITHCISSTSSVRIHPLQGLPAGVPHHVRRRAGVTSEIGIDGLYAAGCNPSPSSRLQHSRAESAEGDG